VVTFFVLVIIKLNRNLMCAWTDQIKVRLFTIQNTGEVDGFLDVKNPK
jgi:hypothetical protein